MKIDLAIKMGQIVFFTNINSNIEYVWYNLVVQNKEIIQKQEFIKLGSSLVEVHKNFQIIFFSKEINVQ
jgi:hypothetical protein